MNPPWGQANGVNFWAVWSFAEGLYQNITTWSTSVITICQKWLWTQIVKCSCLLHYVNGCSFDELREVKLVCVLYICLITKRNHSLSCPFSGAEFQCLNHLLMQITRYLLFLNTVVACFVTMANLMHCLHVLLLQHVCHYMYIVLYIL